jgi:hypothetical protein
MNIIYRQEQALPTISGEVSGGGADVGPRIEEDLAFWSGRTERSPDAYETLQDYWDHVGYGDWTPGGTPWSAAWISYQLRDTGFKGSAAHWQYAQSIIDGESPGWTAFSIPKNNGRIRLSVGDVLIKPRSGSDTNSHGEIVYKIANDRAYLAGGNLSDTAKTATTIRLQNGLATIPVYQILLKKTATQSTPWGWILPLIGGGIIAGYFGTRKK